VFLLGWIIFSFFPPVLFAQESEQSIPGVGEQYFQGEVVEIVNEGRREEAGFSNFFQELEVEIVNGSLKGEVVEVEHGGVVSVSPREEYRVGDKVVLIQFSKSGDVSYSIMDTYRLPALISIIVGFFLLVILVAGRRGIGSIVGLVISFLIIVKFIVPQILDGRDPVLISVVGAIAIMAVTMYLAHSFSKKTTVAVVSTLITLVITGVLSYFFVEVARLSGLGSEDSFLLQFGPTHVNLKGLLLGGMIIGALGVLDDITTSQTSTVVEISRANQKLSVKELFLRGSNVGRDHVASLVNTLVLAYAGASMALFILFVVNPAEQPYWVILNSEAIGEEVVRTIAGSIGLVLAVPITTIAAAWYCRVIKK